MKNYEYVERYTLAGGFCCDLTNNELNQWTEHSMNTPLYKRRQASMAQLFIAKTAPALFTLSELEGICAEEQDIHIECYKLAREWYEELCRTRAAHGKGIMPEGCLL